ncbi:MAG: hypothetical protein FJ335_11625 [Sphingomonadales bacterium]|nr:hypothetical protein [Sphingomonadales bacterium]
MGPAQKADVVHVDDTDSKVVRLTLVTADGYRISAALPPTEAANVGNGLRKAAVIVSGRVS